MKKPSPSSCLRLCFTAALIAAGTACSAAPKSIVSADPVAKSPPAAPVSADPVAKSPPAAPATLSQQITAAIGDAACDNAQQCRTLPVGSKACGGPEGYLAWSSKRSDGALLARLADQQAAAEEIEEKRKGMMSTCSIVMDPGATCSAGHCVLLKPGLGGVPAPAPTLPGGFP